MAHGTSWTSFFQLYFDIKKVFKVLSLFNILILNLCNQSISSRWAQAQTRRGRANPLPFLLCACVSSENKLESQLLACSSLNVLAIALISMAIHNTPKQCPVPQLPLILYPSYGPNTDTILFIHHIMHCNPLCPQDSVFFGDSAIGPIRSDKLVS